MPIHVGQRLFSSSTTAFAESSAVSLPYPARLIESSTRNSTLCFAMVLCRLSLISLSDLPLPLNVRSGRSGARPSAALTRPSLRRTRFAFRSMLTNNVFACRVDHGHCTPASTATAMSMTIHDLPAPGAPNRMEPPPSTIHGSMR